MSDAPVVHIAENSPEHVAYLLLGRIAFSEGKLLTSNPSKPNAPVADRKWLLDTYAECLTTVRDPGSRKPRG